MPGSSPPSETMSQSAALVPPFAFLSLLLANMFLALGPIFVRMADVGPVAAAFWRLAIALPFLFMLAAPGLRRQPPTRQQIVITAAAGIVFAADLAAWHLGILTTKIANATLFGNMSALILPLWGIIVLRHRPSAAQGIALAMAAMGAAILMGSSYEMAPAYLVGDLLCLLAGACYAAYLLLVQGVRRDMGS